MSQLNVFTADASRGRVDGSTTGTGVYLYELEPGEASCPYHYEFQEEWLLVVDGTVSVRTPDGERTFERGELVCFPAGPAGAHKIMNRGETAARTLLWSHRGSIEVSVYPDSDKIGVFPGGDDDGFYRRGDAVEWAYGEENLGRVD
ncbi:MAG TPA: cupin domain-containing protein [Gaiellaceae bacterium]|nr:cupin domain-containing protein [Gaiellaceae bacterium]